MDHQRGITSALVSIAEPALENVGSKIDMAK